jgi:outer membrane protein OmpA-like peptidoglycan-associated protein
MMKSIVGSLKPVMNQIVKVLQPISLSLPVGATVNSITVNGKVVRFKIAPNGTLELPFLIGPKDKIVVSVDVNGQIIHVPITTVNRPIALANVNFNFDSTALTPRAKFILRHVAQVVRQHGFTRIDLIGYTDVLTSPGFSNQKLSNQRAAAARSFILALLRKTKVAIFVAGRAANDPLVKGRSSAARAVNRRVEIIVS